MVYQLVFGFLQMVTIDNVEEYIDLVMDFCLNVGIRRQMEALKGQSELSGSVSSSVNVLNRLRLASVLIYRQLVFLLLVGCCLKI